MTVLNDFNIRRLRDFRNDLLQVADKDLSQNGLLNFIVERRGAVDAFQAYNAITRILQPYVGVDDLAVLKALREQMVAFVDNLISGAIKASSPETHIAAARGDASSISSALGVGESTVSSVGTSPGSSEAADIAEFHGTVGDIQKFELVEARRTGLEETYRQFRTSPFGPGHNGAPEPLSTEDDDDITKLIELLRDQRPSQPVAKREELVEATRKASKIAAKIKEYTDNYLKELAKAAGAETGKQLARVPFWLALWSALEFVVEAVSSWLVL